MRTLCKIPVTQVGRNRTLCNFLLGLAVELVGTSKRSQGGRPQTFEHMQLLRLDNSQSHFPECATFKRVSAQTYVKIKVLRLGNTDMRAASNVVHITCICV